MESLEGKEGVQGTTVPRLVRDRIRRWRGRREEYKGYSYEGRYDRRKEQNKGQKIQVGRDRQQSRQSNNTTTSPRKKLVIRIQEGKGCML